MIEITRYKPLYLEGLKKMMVQENLKFSEISLCLDTLFVIVEREDILGFAYSNIYDGQIFIDHIYVKESERMQKLGDSIFRAILNAHDIEGMQTIYMRNSVLYKGFLDAEEIHLDKSENMFVIDTNDH